MKYMMFVTLEPAPERISHKPDGADAWIAEAGKSHITGNRLRPPADAKTVRVRDGKTIVTDGPFAESKEVIMGFDILDCDSLEEAIAKERELLSPIINSAELVIDTSRMSVYQLRDQIRERVAPRTPGAVSILIESFGYKHGLPANADFVFDVRCLPNPYWEPQLRPLTGKDDRVREFLDAAPMVQRMVDDIAQFLEAWIPRYQDFQRSYLTVAIGCTGGMHRSVYVAEAVANKLAAKHVNIRTHHNEIR